MESLVFGVFFLLHGLRMCLSAFSDMSCTVDMRGGGKLSPSLSVLWEIHDAALCGPLCIKGAIDWGVCSTSMMLNRSRI